MQDHDQSVDPNLVKLADAFDIASAKLKEASEGAEGVSSPALPSADPGIYPGCIPASHQQSWSHHASPLEASAVAMYHLSCAEHVAQPSGP